MNEREPLHEDTKPQTTRKAYEPPRLSLLGSLRELTQNTQQNSNFDAGPLGGTS